MVFRGVQNLPLFAAHSQGFFADLGLEIDQRVATSSRELRSIAAGRYHIVHVSVDNAVAMAEIEGLEIAVVIGGDNGWNDLFVQPEITSYRDMRGRTFVVDATDTAFALQLYQMLKLNGVDPSEINVRPIGATRSRLQALISDKSVAGYKCLICPFRC